MNHFTARSFFFWITRLYIEMCLVVSTWGSKWPKIEADFPSVLQHVTVKSTKQVHITVHCINVCILMFISSSKISFRCWCRRQTVMRCPLMSHWLRQHAVTGKQLYERTSNWIQPKLQRHLFDLAALQLALCHLFVRRTFSQCNF